jgi:hypothetical protein
VTEQVTDLQERVEQRLLKDVSAPVQEESVLPQETALDDGNSLFTKIRFSWRKEDGAILDRIRTLSNVEFGENFKYAIDAIDEFYKQLRIPEQRNGIVVTGADQRPVWRRNEQDQIIEDWNQLTGQIIETTLFKLARLRMEIAPRVNELWLEALYARDVAKDIFEDAFDKIDKTEGGTIPGRTASANIDARADKYAAFFRFYLYSSANTFLKEIDKFAKLLSDIRYWQVRTQKG